MALSTYTELQAAVDAYLGHGLFTTNVPDFIVMAEAAFNRRLRVRQMETFTTLTVSGGLTSFPSDFLAVRSLARSSTPTIVLEYVTNPWAFAAFPSNPAGTARYYALNGNSVSIFPAEDENLYLWYFAKVPSLASESTGTNWLLTEHPDLYLFASLCEAELFGVNDTRAALWKTRRDEIIEEITALSNRSRGPGTIRIMQAAP